MNSLPSIPEDNSLPKSWIELYQQFGIALSPQDEMDITDRLTKVFDLLHNWDTDKNL